jgi:ketosteroid isomerase-like protein
MAQSSSPARAAALKLADRFFSAIERNAMDEVRATFAPGAVVWHNFDPLPARFEEGSGQSVDTTIALLSALPELILEMHYELWSEAVTERGFVRQHIVRGKTASGEEVAIPACVVADVSGGRITRLDEYVNVGHLPASIIEYFSRAG